MQNNEFEKQIRQKMDEFKIHPSGSVWQNVEAVITRTKRRRVGLLFFSLVFTGLLAGWYFIEHQLREQAIQQQQGLTTKPATVSNGISKTVIKLPLVNKTVAKSTGKIKQGENIRGSKQNIKPSLPYIINSESILAAASFKGKRGPSNTNPVNDPGKVIADMKNEEVPVLTKEAEVKKEFDDRTLFLQQRRDLINAESIETNKIETNKVTPIEMVLQPGRTDSIHNVEPAKNKAIKPGALKHSLNWGLTFSAGVSGIPNNFLGTLDKSYSTADAMFALPITNPNSSYASLPAKIESSHGFIAGVFVQKNLRKNAMITVGLNYKKFTTTIKVGVKNDSLLAYRLDNSIKNYRNDYHFVELPLAFKTKIGSGKIQLFADAGVSISRLVSSNAIQFNNFASVYEKDNSLFHKTQFGFNIGLSAALLPRQKTTILIGPYIYYGTTKVARQGLYQNLHFTFIGVRSQLLFKK